MLRYNSLSRRLSGTTAARLILVLGLTGISTIAVAALDITREEMSLLPRYCPYVEGSGNSGAPGAPSPGAKPYVAMMGDNFWHIHHYCIGLVHRQRALRSNTPPPVRAFQLSEARSNYLYVTKHASKDFILLPEIHTAIGEVELRLALPNDANQSFAKARALKPDYWPAYSHWAEFLIRSGHAAEAKPLVRTGLEYSPNSRTLQEQYRHVGGKPSEIVPKKVQELPPGDAAGDTIDPPVVE